MRGGRRLRREFVAIVAVGLVAAACSSKAPSGSAPSPTTTTNVATTTGPSATVAVPPTSGPLQPGTPIETGFGSNDSLLVTEAPDGAVYFACASANCATSGSLTQIWVVSGDQAPRVVDQVSGTVMSLAATGSELFVATNAAITGFDRSNGYTMSTTPDPPGVTATGSFFPTVSLEAGSGELWALYGLSTDQSGYEPSELERIGLADPASPSAQVVSTDVGTAGLAVGESGAFYGDFMKNTLRAASTTGAVVANSSALPAYPHQVTLQTETGGVVVALDLAATSAIQSSVVTYGPTTLAQASSSPLPAIETGQGAAIEATLAGPLLIVGGCNAVASVADGAADVSSSCPTVRALDRVSVSTGATSDPVSLPGALALVGPYPVVVALGSSGFDLVRLG